MDIRDINTTSLADYTLLLVDDDKLIRDIIMQNLRAIGFKRFLQASNGIEAYNIMLEAKYDIQLILCDWEMPKADGLSLLQRVRSDDKSKKIPFIMVTAQQSQERLKIAKAAEYNVEGYIVKPFQAETLRKKVFQALFGTVEEKSEPA